MNIKLQKNSKGTRSVIYGWQTARNSLAFYYALFKLVDAFAFSSLNKLFDNIFLKK